MVTNDKGDFTLDDIQPGDYEVRIAKEFASAFSFDKTSAKVI